MIGEQSMGTYEEIMDFRQRLAVAFERDAAGVEIAVDWVDGDAPDDDPIGTWQDDGGGGEMMPTHRRCSHDLHEAEDSSHHRCQGQQSQQAATRTTDPTKATRSHQSKSTPFCTFDSNREPLSLGRWARKETS